MPEATIGRSSLAETKDETQKLWEEFKGSQNDERLRNRLIERYLPLVRYVAERLMAKLPQNVDLEDLQSAGVFGLVEAIGRFDLSRGVKFETYCTNRIRGAILDELRSMDWVPRLVRARSHQVEKAYAKLEVELGRKPSDVELAKALGKTVEELDELLNEVNTVSVIPMGRKDLDKDDGQTGERLEVSEDKKEPDPVTEIQKRELIEYITKGLSKKERLILILYYYEELTMKEIGATLDLSESRVCQIHSKLMTRLKAQLSKRRHELL